MHNRSRVVLLVGGLLAGGCTGMAGGALDDRLPVDSGRASVDGGVAQDHDDAGVVLPTPDAGLPPFDAGSVVEPSDSGIASGKDAGTTRDAGRPFDGGLTPFDAGVTPVDAGTADAGRRDAGLPPPPPPFDAGVMPPVDAGTPVVSATHPRIVLNDVATRQRLSALLTSNAPEATRFKSMVDAQVGGGDVYGFEQWNAALLSQLLGTSNYCTFAVSHTDAFVASEEALIAGGHAASVAGDSYLEVGPLIGDLALVYDWCFDSLTTNQKSRWVAYANQAVWNVWHNDQAKWGGVTFTWSGWSVDNPVNNYYYSFLQATMLLGLATRDENPQAQTWLDTFHDTKIMNQLVPTFDADLVGGGSREGTGYGTAMKNLFRLYDWWARSTGERLDLHTTHAYLSMAHLLHSIVPTRDFLAPTGDHARDSTAALFDYHRDYLQVDLGLYANDPLAGVVKQFLSESSVPRMSQGFMYSSDFMYAAPNVVARPLTDLLTTYHGEGTGQFMMRSDWSTAATFSNFICGPYTESHAHHDQTSFVVYRGAWLGYDQNVNSHSGIQQGEIMHNLVRLEAGGSVLRQREGRSCTPVAFADDANLTYVSADATAMYTDAAVTRVQREYVFIKPATFVVFDRVNVTGGQRTWQLNVPVVPTQSGNRVTVAAAGSNRLDVFRVSPTSAIVQTVNWSTVDSSTIDGDSMNGGYRVDVVDSSAGGSLFLNVLSTNGDVASVTASDASGQTGALITFADGRTALVRFSNDGPGGTLELKAPDASVVRSGALPTGVQVLPLFAP